MSNMIEALLLDYGGVVVELQPPHSRPPLDTSGNYDSTLPALVTTSDARPRPEMAQLIASFRETNRPVGIVSNISVAQALISRARGDYDPYDFAILSPEVGIRKPDPAIYQLAIASFAGIAAEHILYVDDTPRHLVPAKALGMQTLLAEHDVVMQLQRWIEARRE